MTDGRLRVLIADDQALVRAGFRMILDAQPDIEVVAEAADGESAVRLARRHRPDVVLMDVRMPALDGLEATRLLLGSDGGGPVSAAIVALPRIVILTTFDLDEYVYAALQAGASGFLLKDVSPEHLVGAVRTVAVGDALLAPSITRRLVERYARSRGPVDRVPDGLDRLTARETEVFRLVARGMSNAEVGATLFVTEATVKTHVAGILAKLELRNRAQVVVLAYESGLVRAGGHAAPPTGVEVESQPDRDGWHTRASPTNGR
jgi:DNA-binding NarL/FixJ family response regulator